MPRKTKIEPGNKALPEQMMPEDDGQLATLNGYDPNTWYGETATPWVKKAAARREIHRESSMIDPAPPAKSAAGNPFPEEAYARFRQALLNPPQCDEHPRSRYKQALITLQGSNPDYYDLVVNTLYALKAVKTFEHGDLDRKYVYRVAQLEQNLTACMKRLKNLGHSSLATDVGYALNAFKESGMAKAATSQSKAPDRSH